MKKINSIWQACQPWLAEAISALSVIYYLVLARGYAHSQLSRLDEGMYQVKGFYFAIGRYTIYQDYGVWSNHMPLSFLIPGYIQKWFGPGIRTGRYFAIFLGLLALVGMWLIARRLGGRWWAALVVWAIVLNTAWIKIHTIGLSNALVSAFLVWTLFFALGEQRKTWHFAAAGFFGGLLFCTRINMAPVGSLLPLYIWWQHGRKPGLITAGALALVLLVVHWTNYPGILTLWAYWIPEGLLPFLEPWYAPARKVFVEVPFTPVSAWLTDFDHIVWDSIRSFLHGIRFSFVSMVGIFTTALLWPAKKGWRSTFRFKTVVYLGIIYMILLVFHMWAGLLAHSCHIWCFPTYVVFFNLIGLLVIVLAASSWRKDLPAWRQALAGLSVLLLGMGIGLGSIEETAAGLLNIKLPKITLLPFSYRPKAYILWGLFERRYAIPYEDSVRIIPSLAGLGLAALLLAAAAAGLRALHRRGILGGHSWGWSVMVVVLIVGMAFSPSAVLGAGLRTHECGGDVIAGYEQVGAELAELIPPGSQLYLWYKPTLPLLYIPDALIYPSQLNFTFSYMYPDEVAPWVTSSDQLLRYGLWNEEYKQQWLAEADFVLVEGHRYETDWKSYVDSGEFEIYAVTSPVLPCLDPGSEVILLVRGE